jgi:hypothetical protein
MVVIFIGLNINEYYAGEKHLVCIAATFARG